MFDQIYDIKGKIQNQNNTKRNNNIKQKVRDRRNNENKKKPRQYFSMIIGLDPGKV